MGKQGESRAVSQCWQYWARAASVLCKRVNSITGPHPLHWMPAAPQVVKLWHPKMCPCFAKSQSYGPSPLAITDLEQGAFWANIRGCPRNERSGGMRKWGLCHWSYSSKAGPFLRRMKQHIGIWTIWHLRAFLNFIITGCTSKIIYYWDVRDYKGSSI